MTLISMGIRKHPEPISASSRIRYAKHPRSMSIPRRRFPVSLIHHLTFPQEMSADQRTRFPSKEGPQFHKGCILNITFQCLGLLIMLGMTTYFRLENKRRDKVEGGRPPKGSYLETFEKFDLAPGTSSRADKRQVGRVEADGTGFRYVP